MPKKKPAKKPDLFDTRELINAVKVLEENANYAPISHRLILERWILQQVREMPPNLKDPLRHALDILDEASIGDADRIAVLAMGLRARDLRDVVKMITYAVERADAAERRAVPAVFEDDTLTTSQRAIADKCDAIKAMLLEKNRAYGDSALTPLRVFSKASSEEGILVRIDDKLSRIVQGHAMGEDVVRDLAGYFILLLVARDTSSSRIDPTGKRETVNVCGFPGPDGVTCEKARGHRDETGEPSGILHSGGGYTWDYVNPAKGEPMKCKLKGGAR